MSSRAEPADPRPPLVRTVIVAQLAVIGAFAVVAAMYVGRMLAAGVGPAEMVTGQYDPKDMVPFGLTGWNPFAWLYLVVALLHLAGAVLAPALAVFAVVTVARERRALSGRARALLLGGAVGGLLVLALRFLPAVADMHRWWLD
ncbi:hypothetical protein AB0H57_03945 [Micromonospora sp. NPDC050686]|uniref:hypothetical protein n=1 Tax=Micromonospora sp. NPDC050686 TaxID=3154631 RepID=UPI0033C0926D